MSSARICRSVCVEALESRLMLSDTRFAVVGDFSASQATLDVSNLVKSWNPSFVVTVGDNNYPDGSASTIDGNIGKYYQQFIYPYKGTYGAGAADKVNHFWPSLGNHDWVATGAKPYLDYFTLPNNERYYTTQQGNIGIFVVDSDSSEPDGTSATSIQASWLKNAMAASTAKWKLVFFHHAPYTSGVSGGTAAMNWPFKTWGATAVLSGHDHDYERLTENGLPYFVDGSGGESLTGYNSIVAGSQVRYSSDYGAMLIDAGDTSIDFQFINRSGQVIDDYSIGAATAPAAPSNLLATVVSGTQVSLSWTNNATNQSGFLIERSTDNVNFAQIGTTTGSVTTFADTALGGTGIVAGQNYYYRVRATNAGGNSPYSNTQFATTQNAAYLSDLPWVSATSGWGPVERDTSNGGQSAGDGRTMTLNGVTYSKGIGCHAASTIVFNLAGHYQSFLSDVGVDDEEGTNGSISFQVMADGVKIYDSGKLTNQSATPWLNLNVAGVQQLTLIVTDAGDGNSYDHADWAGARLMAMAGPAAPAAPTQLTASPLSATEINLAWIDNASNESGFLVERSTDNVTFTQIGTTGVGVVTYLDATAVTGFTYYYRVSAWNAVGNSAYSNTASLDVLSRPAAPTGLSAVALSSTQIGLSWTDNSNNESAFGIERSTDNINFNPITQAEDDSTTYTDTSASAGVTYYYRVQAVNVAGVSAYTNIASVSTPQPTLPAGWSDSDIGSVSAAGSASAANGVFTLKGAGTDIWNGADGFNYVYRSLVGDGTIIARVVSVQNTNAWAKAGVMIRETLAAGSREASVVVTPTNGMVFIRRTTANGSSTGNFTGGAAPYWVKLVRSGNTFTGYRSADGVTWSSVGSTSVTMAASVYIGLLVCSKATTSNTSVFDNVSVNGTTVTGAATMQAPLGMTIQGTTTSNTISNAALLSPSADKKVWETTTK